MNTRHRARKRFGQNFLHDQAVIRRIVDAINPEPEQHLVEIGPGQGALTGELLESGCRLDVIELDRDLVPLLTQKFSSCPNIHIHQGDALRFDYSSLATRKPGLRVVGNLPYNISTPLIFHLLQYASLIDDMHFMLQREVVNRLAAVPGNKSWGKLGPRTRSIGICSDRVLRQFDRTAGPVCAERTRFDGGNANAEGFDFQRQCVRQALQGELGAVVITGARSTEQSADRRDVNNVAFSAGAHASSLSDSG